MKQKIVLSALALLSSLSWFAAANPAAAEQVRLNDNWAFHLGDVNNAAQADFDDHAWRRVSVPHDWSIEDRPGQDNPLNKEAIGTSNQGYMDGGIAWYRRTITLPADVSDKTVLIHFEAIYMNAEVWVNGHNLVQHPYGYTPIVLDISKAVTPGNNVVAVKVNHEEPSSRFYSGSGIIRPVDLEILAPVHLDPLGTSITTPLVSSSKATVSVQSILVNALGKAVNAQATSIIVDASQKEVARSTSTQSIQSSSSATIDQSIALTKPHLWSLEKPTLYTLVQEVTVDGVVVDRRRTRFGVRSISFDAVNGFRLNGKKVLLKGGNTHSDNYMLGAAAIPRADARKVELMKSAGYNAIRSSHNPISQATMNAADELGLLIVNEAFDMWSVSKRDKDYSRFFEANWQDDLKSMIVASRNHPSVIMYSMGNEIPDTTSENGRKEVTELANYARSIDATRPATAAVHIFETGTDEFMAPLDVVGYNYYQDYYARDHAKFPKRVMFASESYSRAAFEFWNRVETMPWVVGDFVWTAVDYLGEAGLGWLVSAPYPWHLAMSGEIDATGKLRPAAYYREVLWKTGLTPTSAFVMYPTGEGSLPDGALRGPKSSPNWTQEDLVQSWNWGLPNRQRLKVVVFSEDDEVELFINGDSRGRKKVSRDTEHRANFWVTYLPGELKVVGYVKGKPHSQWTLNTSGEPAAIRLTVDRDHLKADGDDLAYVTAELVDSKGVLVKTANANKPLQFKVTGAGVLAGVGNGNPIAIESFQNGKRSTYQGRAVAVIRANKTAGPVQLEVSGEGLPTVSTLITVAAK